MKEILPQRVRLGVFEVDLRAGELRQAGGAVLILPDQPLQILRILIEADGEMVTREDIRQRLWPDDTIVEFDHSINNAMKKLRRALVDSADEPHYIGTIAKRGYRLLVPVERVGTEEEGPTEPNQTAGPSTRPPTPTSEKGELVWGPAALVRDDTGDKSLSVGQIIAEPPRRSRGKWLAAGAVMVCAVAVAAVFYWRAHRAPKLTERDTIVVTDFDNKTGDPVFDDTLKQALTIQLEQSPFLNVLPTLKIVGTLKLMNRSAAERLTENLARDVCLRNGSKAMVVGSIALLGRQYLIGLRAVECNLGEPLGEVQERADGKDRVLKALDKAANDLRTNLGESLNSVEKYATPLEEATTPSLEALKAYSLGWKIRQTREGASALPFFQRAVELDPNFAMAYAARSGTYGSGAQAALDARKAYELRANVSERERFLIEAVYYWRTTGELEKTVQVYEDCLTVYPRDFVPYAQLGDLYQSLGDFPNSLLRSKDSVRLGGNSWVPYLNLASAYVDLNRLDEALATFNEGEKVLPNVEGLLQGRYILAFLNGDKKQMSQLSAAAIGKPYVEDTLFATEADTEAWYGRLASARTLSQRAMQSAVADESPGRAALYSATAALREVEFGNSREARIDAVRALSLGPSPTVRAMAALALARAGEAQASEKIASILGSDFPLGTLVQRYWLPTIQASLALRKNDPNGALHQLNAMGRLELSTADGEVNVFLCPAYIRANAHLMLRDGKGAAAEFQKLLDYYGLVGNFPWGALARLGLARAYALEAQTDPAARDKARTAYQNFLTLWKDADPDIPIYKQAQAEYAKLQEEL